jgi:hypothetical protein
MTELRKAAEIALEEFELFFNTYPYMEKGYTLDARKALRQALAQPEQEPVAWRTFDGEGGYDYRSYEMNENYDKEWAKRNSNYAHWVEPLYTAPPKKDWVGLTDDDVHDAFNYVEMVKLLDFDRDRPEWCEAFASACEARLRHKNGGNK